MNSLEATIVFAAVALFSLAMLRAEISFAEQSQYFVERMNGKNAEIFCSNAVNYAYAYSLTQSRANGRCEFNGAILQVERTWQNAIIGANDHYG